MKKSLALVMALACLVVQSAFCDQEIDAKSWQNVGKFNPTILGKTLGDHVGQLVAVQFNFRGKDIRHIKPNWYEASVWQPDAAEKKGFSNVRVLFAKKELATFESITTDATSRVRLTLYGRVERDADSHYYFVRLFGRRATVDSSGNANVAW